MKRTRIALLAATACLALTTTLAAQMNLNPFRKPNITDIFHPLVGSGATYEIQHTDNSGEPTQMEMVVVGTEMVGTQQGYWMEMGHTDRKTGQMSYIKMLVTPDFQPQRVIIQAPGKGAMEMPFNAMAGDRKNHAQEELDKWHKVGMEPVTVPAGTFLCQHWKKDSGVGDVWASDKVTPISMVKSVQEHETMTLQKTISGATDHITGPVTKFDPQEMMRQRQRQKPQ
ncbi:MAG TPA: hypothetical protein VN780_03940 [Candidatus Eisenbacteria bacterium]|jgi:hypothetical protein|nr:hypothetical protein [Candidatus Eisenbacteria bacterium]